jgi:hypothetical protein
VGYTADCTVDYVEGCMVGYKEDYTVDVRAHRDHVHALDQVPDKEPDFPDMVLGAKDQAPTELRPQDLKVLRLWQLKISFIPLIFGCTLAPCFVLVSYITKAVPSFRVTAEHLCSGIF